MGQANTTGNNWIRDDSRSKGKEKDDKKNKIKKNVSSSAPPAFTRDPQNSYKDAKLQVAQCRNSVDGAKGYVLS